MWNQVWNFITGNASSVVAKVEETFDEYIYTDEEKSKDKDGIEEKRRQFKAKMAEITQELTENQSKFKLELEQIVAEREKQIHETYRAEMSLSKDIIEAELKQSNCYTKSARPTIIYVGLLLVLLEVFGVRLIILDCINAKISIIDSSTEILTSFFYVWGGVVGVYAAGRSVEKRGTSNRITQLATGNQPLNSDQVAKTIEQKVKEKIQW